MNRNICPGSLVSVVEWNHYGTAFTNIIVRCGDNFIHVCKGSIGIVLSITMHTQGSPYVCILFDNNVLGYTNEVVGLVLHEL